MRARPGSAKWHWCRIPRRSRRAGIIFNNTLFDENAASHVAVGQSYTENIRDGSNRSQGRTGGTRCQQQPRPCRLDDRLGKPRCRWCTGRRHGRAADAQGRVGDLICVIRTASPAWAAVFPRLDCHPRIRSQAPAPASPLRPHGQAAPYRRGPERNRGAARTCRTASPEVSPRRRSAGAGTRRARVSA